MVEKVPNVLGVPTWKLWPKKKKVQIEKVDCIVFKDGLTKGALSTVDTCLPQLNTNGVTVERAVHITTKVSYMYPLS